MSTSSSAPFASCLRVLCILLLPFACAAQTPAPDIIFLHGDILTGAHLKPNDPDPTPARVHALAIRDGRITAAGGDAQILALKGPHTEIIDLHGHFAMPGFNDAHTHIASAGQQRLAANLNGTTSLADMQSRLRAYIKTLPPADKDSWIVGGGWDHTKWPSKTLPTRQDLDAVTGTHPALLERVDGHIAVANTLALQAAHIDDTTPNPFGGHIDRDTDGHATGIIRETPALTLIQQHIPPPSFATRRKALELSINDALAHGVTSLQDFSDWDDWLVLEELEHENKLPLRIAEWVDFTLPLPVLDTRRASHDPNDPLLHLTSLKGFMDGSLGSRTAAMNDPYSDDPANYGITRFQQDKLNQMAAARAADGFQLNFHAIGDRANDMALDALAAAEQAGRPASHTAPPRHPDAAIVTEASRPISPRDFRFRIEHAQVVSPGAFDRFHDLGIIASMQPAHLLDDMAWASQRIGPERSKFAYAWKSFLDHGVLLAFGTDYPVVPINPFLGLYAATTRMNLAGTAIFDPPTAAQEEITLNEALYAYTQGSAYAEFREHIKGRLEPGFLADLIVLDRDPTTAAPQQLLHTKVLRTVVGGQTRYTAP
ncbi:MAG TPA: amidohydrolase [Acidobacteriaceae bacterium]